MKEVTIFFLAGAAFISILEVLGVLNWIIRVAAPVTVGWLGLPPQAAAAFVMGFVRRDFGAAGFFTMNLTSAQLLVAMVTITLFVPCIASTMVVAQGARLGVHHRPVRELHRAGVPAGRHHRPRDRGSVAVAILAKCPSCGLASDDIRCPRCNALKVVGCSGSCALCKSGCDTDSCEPASTPAPRPPEHARDAER